MCKNHIIMSSVKELAPAALRSAAFLDTLAAEYQVDFAERGGVSKVGLLRTNAEVVLSWGSMCSGSEVILFALIALPASYMSRGVKVKFEHRCSCECKESKQK